MPTKRKPVTKESLASELRKLSRQKVQMEALIQKLRKSEEKWRRSEERYRSLVESTEDSIYLVDTEYRYLFINKKHLQRIGLLKRQVPGKTYGDFHSEAETKWFIEKMKQVFETGSSVQSEHRSMRDGKDFLRTFSPIKGPGGRITAVTVVSKDVTRLKKMEEKLHFLSVTDDLTRIYNRRGFFTIAEHLIKLARRMKKGMHLLYVDLDGLKEINDTYGHHEGDMALIELATILKSNYRESDVVARIGGDEFVVIPVGAEGDSEEMIKARLQKKLDLRNETTDRKFKLVASCGVVLLDPSSPGTLDELLIQADAAMYEEKKRKREGNRK